MLKLGSCLPRLLTFLATRLVATANIYQNLMICFDYVMLYILIAVRFISELTTDQI